MMQAYTGFAQVYDLFMDNIPYEEWSNYLIKLLRLYGVEEGLVLDMGCGTGKITKLLAKKGYDMIGIDNSMEMLSIAMLKEETEQKTVDNKEMDANDSETRQGSILYLLQDMREFELYGTVAAVVSICDSINYITSEEDLVEVFRLVNNYLDTDGLFIFDLNTVYKYEHILAENTIAENREDCSFIWDNYYYKEEMINEYDLTIYVKDDMDPEQDNCFRRFDETHYQKAYSLDTIKSLLEEAGMEYVTAYDAFSEREPHKASERIYIVAKEKKQDTKLYI
jgi:SAM-dependent methyltransferase